MPAPPARPADPARAGQRPTRRITVDDDGGLVDTQTGFAVTAIDLRDGQPATVQLADMVLPAHASIVELDHPDPVPATTSD